MYLKRSIIAVIILFPVVSLFSQPSYDLWPIQGKNAGEDIILKPNEYIGNELNNEGLFISAQKGTNVLAPRDGIITHISYRYQRSLHGSNAFHDSLSLASNVDEYDTQFRNKIAKEKKGIDPEFISIGITISVGTKEKYSISGLRPVKKFKTGDKVKRSEIIGKVGYCYRLIKQPSICFSRSKNDTIADPMTLFGLKSTFVPFKKDTVNYSTYKIPVNNLKYDFMIFRETLEEGHPGLYDYTSKEVMDKMFEKTLQKITIPMTSLQFLKLLYPIIDSIRDSHTTFLPGWGKKNTTNVSIDELVVLPVKFGLLKEGLIVHRALDEYKQFLGKRITSINGVSVDSLRVKVKCMDPTYCDGYITGQADYYRMGRFSRYYQLTFHKKKGDKVSMAFSDGSKTDFTYEPVKVYYKFYPKLKVNLCLTEKFHMDKLTDETALLKLNTFDLLQNEEDSIGKFIKDIANTHYHNLIIDLRGNRGGSSETLSKLYSFIANEPFKTSISSMVNKTGNYNFFKYCSNFPSDYDHIFDEYVKVEGKRGYYLPTEQIPFIKPDDKIHFSGKIYVLTDEYSQSASAVFAGLVHKYKRGLIVGRETGSTYHQLNASKFVKVTLKNSALELQIPLKKEIFCDRYDSDIPWGRGVIPDYPVDFSFDELFEKNQFSELFAKDKKIDDKTLNYTLSLIDKKAER
jgi:Periplasmic protease